VIARFLQSYQVFGMCHNRLSTTAPCKLLQISFGNSGGTTAGRLLVGHTVQALFKGYAGLIVLGQAGQQGHGR
jgi:hypothetical protein